MSDFLFRMIERAAGLSVATAPQPPREFHWPLPLEAPGTPSNLSRAEVSLTERRAAPYFAAEGGSAWRQVAASKASSEQTRGKLSISTAQDAEGGAQELQMRPVAEPGAVFSPSHETRPASAPSEAKDLTLADEAPLAAARPIKRAVPEAEVLSQNALAVDTARSTFDRALESQPARPEETGEIRARTAHPASRAYAFPAAEERRTVLHDVDVRTQAGLPVPRAREREMQTGMPQARARQEAPEPPVEVKIGSVEIRFDVPPAQAAPPAIARPAGFAEFAALRRYAQRPWPSRSR